MPVSDELMARLRTVKSRHETKLMRKANVVGVGIGFRMRDGEMTDEPSIVVSVTHKLPGSTLNPQDAIPAHIEGVPVDVQAVGELRAFDAGGKQVSSEGGAGDGSTSIGSGQADQGSPLDGPAAEAECGRGRSGLQDQRG